MCAKIFVGVGTKWHSEYTKYSNDLMTYVIKITDRIVGHHESYLSGMMKTNIMTAGIECDCPIHKNSDGYVYYHDPKSVCPKIIIDHIIEIVAKVEDSIDGLQKFKRYFMGKMANKKFILSRILFGERSHDPIIYIGQKLNDKYIITGKLLSGSSSVIYRGKNTFDNDKEVVIKISGATCDGNIMAYTEYTNLSNLSILKRRKYNEDDDIFFPKLIDYFTLPSSPWSEKEYHTVLVVDKYGKDMHDVIFLEKSVKDDQYLETVQHIFRQLAKIVKVLHENDLIHKDIKPENILLRHTDWPKNNNFDVLLIDYATTMHVETNDRLTHYCGTLAYISPEEITGVGYNKPSDIWNLCLTMLEIYRRECVFSNDISRTYHILSRVFGFHGLGMYNNRLIGLKKYGNVKEMYMTEDEDGVALDQNYFTHDILDDDFKDLIKKGLVYRPEQRITIDQIICHPFLTKTIGSNQ
jgi:serine/threonine protein kinase